jgi:hypothetical protein
MKASQPQAALEGWPSVVLRAYQPVGPDLGKAFILGSVGGVGSGTWVRIRELIVVIGEVRGAFLLTRLTTDEFPTSLILILIYPLASQSTP